MLSLANLTLQKRITLTVLIGTGIGLGVFSWLGIQSLKESTDLILNERLTIARTIAGHLDETLEYIQVELQDINSNNKLPTEEEFNSTAEMMRRELAKSGLSTQSVILINSEGKILQTDPETPGIVGLGLSGYPEVKLALEKGLPTISGLVLGPFNSVPVVFATTPIVEKSGKIIGAIAVSIDIEQSSNKAFKPTTTVGETGYTELVDSNGIVIARTRPVFPPAEFERSDHAFRFAQLISQGKTIVRTCHRCHEVEGQTKRRRDVLAFAPLSSTSWGVAIRQSEEEALAPTRQLEKSLLLMGIILLIGTFSSMWILMQGIVMPIKVLTSAIKRVAAGDFIVTIPVKRRDELGELSTAFYTMTQELVKSRNELVLRNEEMKTYTTYVIRAQEEERQRLARELHDGTIQSLVLLCRRLDSMHDKGELLPSSVTDRLQEARVTAEEAVRELRDVTKALRPPILDDLGMVTSIRRLLDDFVERTGAKGQQKVVGQQRRLPSDTELGIFRIAQEALRNVERHAKATRVTVTITFAHQEVGLEVADNGVGFSVSSVLGDLITSGQHGLLSMRERAELLGGKFEIQSSFVEGTRVMVSIPVAGDISQSQPTPTDR